MSIETQLADFAVNSEPSPDALEMMRLSLMDWAACGIAGREEPLAVILRDKGLSEGRGIAFGTECVND